MLHVNAVEMLAIQSINPSCTLVKLRKEQRWVEEEPEVVVKDRKEQEKLSLTLP